MKISQTAFDLIVKEEVTSKAYYERHYTHPEWPGVSSGVTVGIGYDLGQAAAAKIKADWQGRVSNDMLLVMMRCSGVTGTNARDLLPEVKAAIVIPWAAANDVFSNRDVPQWTAAVLKACPGAELLTPTCLGGLVSVAYNRGCGGFTSSSDRNIEMRAIRRAIIDKNYTVIAGLIRAMARLWPTVKGLRDRREHEAALFETGLTATDVLAKVPSAPPALDPDVPLNEGPARTKPPATSTAQNTTTGTVIVGGTIAAQQAHAHGLISTDVAIFIGFLAVLGAVTAWLLWWRNRNPS